METHFRYWLRIRIKKIRGWYKSSQILELDIGIQDYLIIKKKNITNMHPESFLSNFRGLLCITKRKTKRYRSFKVYTSTRRKLYYKKISLNTCIIHLFCFPLFPSIQSAKIVWIIKRSRENGLMETPTTCKTTCKVPKPDLRTRSYNLSWKKMKTETTKQNSIYCTTNCSTLFIHSIAMSMRMRCMR